MKAIPFLVTFLLLFCPLFGALSYFVSNQSKSVLQKRNCFVRYAKKGMKKSALPQNINTNGASMTNTDPSPRRVTNQINVSVRKQIAWAKAYKRLENSARSFNVQKIKKNVKKERSPKPQPEEYVEIDYINTRPPAVFVDGYNIIGYINEKENRKINLDEARDMLINDLAVLQGATGWWIEVIFDSYQVPSPAETVAIGNLLITYTAMGETADSYIEKHFYELRQEGFTNMVVATDDLTLRMVAGSSGSGFVSASMLMEELRIAYYGWENLEREIAAEADKKRPTFEDTLSDEVRAAIQKMKETSKNG